jgi:hypothetical protein
VLHHNGNTATIDRKDFKEFIAANKRHRKRMKRPQLKLVVNNKIQTRSRKRPHRPRLQNVANTQKKTARAGWGRELAM